MRVELLFPLQVIPQFIARIDTPRTLVGRLIHQLLMDVGKEHPQALIYPLTVASKSNVAARQTAANKILKNMREHSNNLVKQAILVCAGYTVKPLFMTTPKIRPLHY